MIAVSATHAHVQRAGDWTPQSSSIYSYLYSEETARRDHAPKADALGELALSPIMPARYEAMMRTVSLALAFGALLVGAVAAQEIKTDDGSGRTALTLTSPEKAYVLDQMRQFVRSIQGIAAGLADGDSAQAAEAAAARGIERNANDPAFPPTLGAKLPLAWKQFGGGMRKGFDTLAQGISDRQDTNQSLRQLSELMKNCVGCHASYRIADAKL